MKYEIWKFEIWNIKCEINMKNLKWKYRTHVDVI